MARAISRRVIGTSVTPTSLDAGSLRSRVGQAATRTRESAPRLCTSRAPRGKLLCLQGLDVLVQVSNAHLNFALMALAHVPEQVTPNRHVFRSMRR